MKQYEAVIGIECHVQLNTRTKLFCSCSNDSFGKKPNSSVCPVCAGFPGTLPVANVLAIKWGILGALALNCKINHFFKFDRKHYFYPDLPKGYQISQYDQPVGYSGWVEIEAEGQKKKIRINRLHIEEDAGKLTHEKGSDYSLVDLNRAGTPLLEIVTEPDIRTAAEGKAYGQLLHATFRYLGISDANMEQGNLRIEPNISVREVGASEFGTKVEVKNLNSFRSVERAIHYEIERQIQALESGETIVQETRGWDESKQKTVPQRSKEEAHDYRYFPEPDLPPFHYTRPQIDEVKSKLPELPNEKKARFVSDYGLSHSDAATLTGDKDLAGFYEAAVAAGEIDQSSEQLRQFAKKVCNLISGEMLRLISSGREEIANLKLKPSQVAELVGMVEQGDISTSVAKEVFRDMFETGKSGREIAEEKGLSQISDINALVTIVEKVLNSNQKSVEDYLAGKEAAAKFLVGQVMKESKGQANPQLASDMIEDKLKELSK